jgi:hypothetical protein
LTNVVSHCWGKNPQKQIKLTSGNIAQLKSGIRLNELPKTFREAVEFAARLPRVGYIWIDSLCIKQGQNERDDWLKQSATMDRVYSETFLNISATAASSSDQGLFFSRSPELLLEDEVILNIEGIPGVQNSLSRRNTSGTEASSTSSVLDLSTLDRLIEASWLAKYLFLLLSQLYWIFLQSFTVHRERGIGVQNNSPPEEAIEEEDTASSNGSLVGRREIGEFNIDGDRKQLRRCTILDVSFWQNHVDRAPVNCRGWVLQERLMAPRVLHFCRDQIAWECSEFDAAEGLPQDMPNFQLTSDGIVEESRLKGLNPKKHGSRLRRIRLQGYDDPDPHLDSKIYALELWKRIVEVYSRTQITNSGDKLIALSGMARMMARKIGSPEKPEEYIAGLWKTYLASQLLWKVEPVFRETDGHFEHPSTAPNEYRAPSFSWASIDTDKGHGIAYGEVTDRDLLISVDQYYILAANRSNEYGMISERTDFGTVGTYIIIQGKLRKAQIFKKPLGRYGWRLLERDSLNKEEHTNVYLDCPSRDEPDILGPDAGVYVVPAARGERTASNESKYLICLLLQEVKGKKIDGIEGGGMYRRIGLTKLSPWADHMALQQNKILEVFSSDIDLPHQGFDAETGMHRILIV